MIGDLEQNKLLEWSWIRRTDFQEARAAILNTIRATVAEGRLELNVPADWIDGTEVKIHRVAKESTNDEAMSPEEIAQLLSTMDQLASLELTETEHADWEARMQTRKDWEKAGFAERVAKLKGLWE